ncbi:hypothetical protein OG562_22110 [Streptomyces sp. NBC_01275]|uniref:hypothetical protein n=1 Tax=Streptomyces sp. NBC_01275 TaxID=2903807 RepID=UPI00225B7F6D|nr:hypothetical protein [Streptomyces sp. NBC_01275]MCX4763607.1 hypothetical protein [Streptomyces sp. NBC_01275]
MTAAVLFTTLLAAGCGGGGGDSDAKESASTSGSTSAAASGSASATESDAPAAAPLDEPRLKSAAVTGGDVDGFQITEFPAKPDGGGTARPAACQPLENMRTASPDPGPKAFVGLLAYAGAGPSAGSATTVGLMAYDQSAAAGILDGLRTALKTCTAYEGGVPARTTAESATAPDAGDDAVAFRLTTSGDSSDAFVVVRTGATVVLFYTASGTGSAAEVPEALVSAQIKKLEQAA